ncbi:MULTISPECIES: hypothetical protein [Roseobacteraceae]|jgi:hypothetical protein|uniref:hypothetical protein n=1 Tax=Roseobacteraceae TaxID=2854170 RepID=UPI000BBE6E38|nr:MULTISPECIES: hypothetical protein [Roseobacteraceae]QDI74455.1 hypothetical protein R2C4_01300 [Leisingera aquaemixtae]
MSKANTRVLSDKAARMVSIRQERRKAGFVEVTVWLPVEQVRHFRDKAWQAVEAVGRTFPRNSLLGQKRRQRGRK